MTLRTPWVPVTLRQMYGTKTSPGHVPTGFSQQIRGCTIGPGLSGSLKSDEDENLGAKILITASKIRPWDESSQGRGAPPAAFTVLTLRQGLSYTIS